MVGMHRFNFRDELFHEHEQQYDYPEDAA